MCHHASPQADAAAAGIAVKEHEKEREEEKQEEDEEENGIQIISHWDPPSLHLCTPQRQREIARVREKGKEQEKEKYTSATAEAPLRLTHTPHVIVLRAPLIYQTCLLSIPVHVAETTPISIALASHPR